MLNTEIQRGNLFLQDAKWFFCGEDIIGIVIAYNRVNRSVVAFIGRGHGENKCRDAVQIMEHGAPFPIASALRLFEDLSRQIEIKVCSIYECIVELLDELKEIEEHPEKFNL